MTEPVVLRSRWSRLWPGDATDVALALLVVVGLLLTALHAAGARGYSFGAIGLVLVPLLVLHGSCPVFAFLGLACYLARRGRVIGHARRWLVAGVVVTAPLWFLMGTDLTAKSVGSLTWLVWSWNLGALVLLGIGVWRTLADPR